MKALVVHGSKSGGTEGLAEMIGRALTDLQWQVTVRPAAEKASEDETKAGLQGSSILYVGGRE